MKTVSRHGLLALLATTATAFPKAIMDEYQQDPEVLARAAKMLEARASGPVTANSATHIFEPVPIFNAKEQYVDVGPGSGHEWQAPGPNDIRGPCPGLNAFANHGFLPRNGYATILEFITATNTVVGMGPQLAAFLAAFGAAIDGDGTAWSIGGTPSVAVAGVLGNKGNGISNSHNKYESDASPTRPDLYEFGNDYKTRAVQFQELINMSPGGVVDMDSLASFRSYRFTYQIAHNEYFFNGPFTGVLVQPAAYTFIYRFMANHSEEYPYGELSYENIEYWFGMTKGSDGQYIANQGQERIPNNWFRRALAYPYDNEYFLADVANAGALHPKFFSVGGNLGKTNSFAGVDISNLTGGVYNSQNLAHGNNFACLAYEFAAQETPDIALPIISKLSNITSRIGALTSQLSCPNLSNINQAELEQYPGYKKSQSS